MGASLSWLVCDSQYGEELKELLGASDCKQGEAPAFCVDLTPEKKIFILEARGRKWEFDKASERERLSQEKEVYFGIYEEHVMFSEAALWRDGKEIWRVTHENEKGIYDLQVQGSLPDSFEKIKERIIREQNEDGGEDSDVDYVIGIPTALLSEFTGYDCAEEEPDGDYSEWVITPKSKGLFSRLFKTKR